MKRVNYAWVVLGLCFFGLLAAQGARLSFGAFVAPWEASFGVDRATVSFVSFISFLVYGFTQPVVGRLVDRFGSRLVLSLSVLLVGLSLAATAFSRGIVELTLIYGVVASLGFGGASGVAASVAVTRWFNTNRGLAFGIIEAGMAAGQFVLVPTSLVLINTLGWRGAMLALGGFGVLVVFPLLLLLLRSTPEAIGARPYGEGETHNAQLNKFSVEAQPPPTDAGSPNLRAVFGSRAFWGLALPFFICGVTTTGMIDTHLVPFAHDHGFNTGVAGTAVALLAAFNIVGTLVSGPLADRFDNRRILGALYFTRALSLLLLLAVDQPGLLFAFGVTFGLVDFAVLAPVNVLTSRYFHGQSIGFMFGVLSLFHQVGSAVGAYVPGLLYTLTGSYTVSSVIATFGLLAGAALSISLPSTNISRRQSLPTGAS
ncbi:MAG: transporter, putative [uncultured Truepera sp.]|uniref:Transporter, putative n=1 Tax=uncultured Truepera sp. TaxID=543023 RepID=A0A6J4V195_9DEIN|nr:MAG: transporter, putative [uncultured Truepera sp.]